MSIDTKRLRQAAASVRAFLKPEYGREIAQAADHIDALEADNKRLRDLLDDHRIREVLGYVEDAGPADVWACAQSWIVGRDAALSGEGK